MTSEKPKTSHATLGQLISEGESPNRDALHVAVVPLTAAHKAYLRAGEPFKLNTAGLAVSCHIDDSIGVADPFLKESIRPGERFWGLLIPGSVSNLRHDFDHHAWPKVEVAPTVIEKIVEKPEDPEITAVREYAQRHGITLSELCSTAGETLNDSCRGC